MYLIGGGGGVKPGSTSPGQDRKLELWWVEQFLEKQK